jgi:chromate transporter
LIYLRLIWEFLKIGAFAFGGGMATIPFLQDLAERTGWFTQEQLADMIAVSESTPGPIGINIATYVGFTTAGVLGSVCATLSVVAPGFACMLIIARLYDRFRTSEIAERTFYGLRPASAGLISAALYALALITLVSPGKAGWAFFNLKPLALAAVLFALTNLVKPIKSAHPVFLIAASAIIGAIARF